MAECIAYFIYALVYFILGALFGSFLTLNRLERKKAQEADEEQRDG